MGLDIYFYDGVGENAQEIESESLGITHNLNTVVSELGLIVGLPYYEIIWRPDELFDCENGKVRVKDVLIHLPDLISNLVSYQDRLEKRIPENRYGTFDGLIRFLCDYLKECSLHQDKYIYCCR